MSKRLSYRKKWQDKWYLALSNNSKLLFDYMCDNCDNSGVYEWNEPLLVFTFKVESDQLEKMLEELSKKISVSKDGELIFIKNFLRLQKKLPLKSLAHNPHKPIILRLLRVMSEFEDNSGITDLIPSEELEKLGITPSLPVKPTETTLHKAISEAVAPDQLPAQELNLNKTEKSKTNEKQNSRKKREKFVPPTVQDIYNHMIDKCKEKGIPEDKYNLMNWSESCHAHYSDVNWQVSGQKKQLWRGKVTKWFLNNIEGGQFFKPMSNGGSSGSKEKKSKVESIGSSQVSGNIDFNDY